jgi:hypothetical protein
LSIRELAERHSLVLLMPYKAPTSSVESLCTCDA